MLTIRDIIDRIRSPNADKIYVGKDFTPAELIAALERLIGE